MTEQQPEKPVGPHAWAEHYNQQREQAPAGRKLLDQLSDRELEALYERAEQAENAVKRVGDTAAYWERLPEGSAIAAYAAAYALRVALEEPTEPST